MTLLTGAVVAMGAGLLYAGTKVRYYKKNQLKLIEDLDRQSIYSEIYPIKRVLSRYHRLMEPHDFCNVAHQQARFWGIQGAINSCERLMSLLESEWVDALEKTEIKRLIAYNTDFLKALSTKNDAAKNLLRDLPVISERPPCPKDLKCKMRVLRNALDQYDDCLHLFNVEIRLAKAREAIEILRFYAPEVLVKPEVWEAFVRHEHFLIELVNLLPDNLQKGSRTDATMLQPAG